MMKYDREKLKRKKNKQEKVFIYFYALNIFNLINVYLLIHYNILW